MDSLYYLLVVFMPFVFSFLHVVAQTNDSEMFLVPLYVIVLLTWLVSFEVLCNNKD